MNMQKEKSTLIDEISRLHVRLLWGVYLILRIDDRRNSMVQHWQTSSPHSSVPRCMPLQDIFRQAWGPDGSNAATASSEVDALRGKERQEVSDDEGPSSRLSAAVIDTSDTFETAVGLPMAAVFSAAALSARFPSSWHRSHPLSPLASLR